jgi:hypothetical protein
MGLFCSFFFTLFLFLLHIQPLRGWGPSSAFPQVSPRAIHIQPLSGLGSSPALPQVSPGAIISLRSEREFIFNPYRGWGLIIATTRNKTRVKNEQAFGNRFNTLASNLRGFQNLGGFFRGCFGKTAID